VAFQGRDRGTRVRNEPGSGSVRRRRLKSIRPAPCSFPVETLETRVLLSTNPLLTKFFALSGRDFSPASVVIVPLVVHTTPGVVRTATAIDGPVNLTASPEVENYPSPEDVGGMGIAGAIDLNPSPAMIAIAGPNGTTSGGQDASAPIMTVESYSTDALNEESVPPLVVMTGPVTATTVGGGTVSDPLTWNPEPPPSLSAPSSGVADPDEGPVASGGEIGLATIPVARHVEFNSMLDSTHSAMSILIPIGPATEAIGVSLHPTEADEPEDVPVVDGMVLEDRDGDTIAQLGPFGGPQATGPIRALTIALENAPVGGSLLVQVSLPMVSSSGPGTVTAAPQSVGSAVPFMMDVQRQNVAAAMTGETGLMVLGPLPGQVGSGIGTFSNVSTTDQNGNAADLADSSSAAEDAGEQTFVADQGKAIPPDEESSDSVENRNGNLDLGMGTGPLVSRSSAPLGPMLATLLADPAPPVDRHERALSQAIEESGSSDDSDAATRSQDLTRVKGSSSESPSGPTTNGTTDGTRVASAGLGAFPLKVTGAGGGNQGTDLESLLVSLPGSLKELGTPAVVAAMDHEQGDISMSMASAHHSTRTDHRIAPTLLTAACGLALGLGLTARPLLPDLLALVPQRFSRSKRSVPVSKSGRESTSEWAASLENRFRELLNTRLPRGKP
jgi:hypothetical protein